MLQLKSPLVILMRYLPVSGQLEKAQLWYSVMSSFHFYPHHKTWNEKVS